MERRVVSELIVLLSFGPGVTPISCNARFPDCSNLLSKRDHSDCDATHLMPDSCAKVKIACWLRCITEHCQVQWLQSTFKRWLAGHMQ